MSLAPDDPRHGTVNGYNNLKCRCDACRDAWRVYHREWRHRTGYSLPFDLAHRVVQRDSPHGTEARYVKLRCRCDECRRAATEARWLRRLANREATRAYDRAYKARRRAAGGAS